MQTTNGTSLIRNLILGILGLILLGLVFGAGVATGIGLNAIQGGGIAAPFLPSAAPTTDSSEQEDVDLSVFWEAWNTLHQYFYYDLPGDQDLVYGAIRGMVDAVGDPYTAFVTPDVAEILREDNTGTFEGIGAYVEEAPEGGVHIIRVFEGAPAEEAGLRAGDVVIAVDGQPVTDMILNEALLLIRGPAGTEVTLTVVRQGESRPLDITVTRGRIEIPTVEYRMLDNNIGYVALFEFNASSSERLEAAVRDLLDQGAESLILDLRDNPGGFLDQSIKIADVFLDQGTVLIERDVEGNEEIHTSKNGGLAEDIPLVVLINGNSASASEIVAGAIKDRGRGTLIGQTSFGKGSVQLLFDLSDGSQLRVTFATWYTPDDHSINGSGVEPDIVVELPLEPTSTDLILERAIQFLTTGQ